MTRQLVLSFRFLSPWFHGRGDGGEPEWPPSPLRVFQALVAASGRSGALDKCRDALFWLESSDPPQIFAAEGITSSTGYSLSVPHNAMDLVARQWARGKDGDATKHRTMKCVRPVRLSGDAAVHYAWPLDGSGETHVETIVQTAKLVVALGWGSDLVAGNGVVEHAAALSKLQASTIAWTVSESGTHGLRVPTRGTLNALERRYEAFLMRMSTSEPTLRPPPPLSSFRTARYSKAGEMPIRPVATFALLRPGENRLRAFDTAPRGKVVAGMLRHAARAAAERAGWSPERIASSVMGHGSGQEPRLSLLPVPSVEFRGDGYRVGAIRRALVFSSGAESEHAAWAARFLGGVDLIDEDSGEIAAVLAAVPATEPAFSRFLGEAKTWVSVTPVVLPGWDDPGGLRKRLMAIRDSREQARLLDRLADRREALVRKAIRQAGLSDELAFEARIEIRETGFLAGLGRAIDYAVPQHLARSPRLHVRLEWPWPVRGPFCIGSGRFTGLGLFVRAP